MTIAAGVYDFTLSGRDAGLPDELAALLKAAGAASVEQRRQGRLTLVWHDHGAYPDPGIHEDQEGLCLLAGDPLYQAAPRPRNEQARMLAAALEEPGRALAGCPGTFAAVRFRAADENLLLATDALGSRPLYYATQNGRLYFSSCLSVLEGLRGLRRTVSARALFERLTFHFNLDGRTPYQEIRVLRQGESLEARPEGVATAFYHSWDGLPPVELDYPARVERIYELFRQAVERRSWRSDGAVAMLSGGLDSRMNVAVLRQLGKRVAAVNCAPEYVRLKDEIYAQRVAEALGCDLVRVRFGPGPVDWGALARRGLEQAPRWLDPGAARLVFSGDGGSVGLGLVYYAPETIQWMREGRIERVLDEYLKPFLRLPDRYLQRPAHGRVGTGVRAAVRALTLNGGAEPGRQFHLFLMNGDQRCHLHGYFEAIARLGHDLHTPFYDADLLRFALACPVDDFAGHRLYHDLLAYLPAGLARIPWQTYPGHLPCPVPEDGEDAASQFSEQAKRALKPALMAGTRPRAGLALSRDFPAPPFRRLPVLAASLAAASGQRRFDYVLKAAEAAAVYLRRAGGRFAWDLEGGA